MRLKVAAVNAAEWVRREPEVKAVLGCGIDAIDIRIQSLRRGPSADEMRLANWARAAGVEVHAHSWVGSRGPSGSSNATAHDGAQQGLYAVASVAAMHAVRFAVNAERDVEHGLNLFRYWHNTFSSNPVSEILEFFLAEEGFSGVDF